MSENNEDIKSWLVRWAFRYGWLVVLVLLLTNLLFRPVMNIVVILLIAAVAFNAWSKDTRRLEHRIFPDDPIPVDRGKVYWYVFAIESLVLLVGLHFYYKGITSMSGITETWFNMGHRGGTGFIATVFSVAFMMAVAVVATMLVLLYFISHTPRNMTLIMVYIFIDVFIVMPYNFRFSYENNQKEGITTYYSGAITPLYNILTKRQAPRQDAAERDYDKVRGRNASIDSSLAERDSKINQLTTEYYSQWPTITNDTMRRRYTYDFSIAIKRLKDEKRTIGRQKDTTVSRLEERKLHEERISDKLDSITPIVKGLENGKIEKKDLYDSVINAAKVFQSIIPLDSGLVKDSSVARLMSRLEVVQEPSDKGLGKLLHGWMIWILKDGDRDGAAGSAVTSAQQEWNEQLPTLRTSSFLFSILIDIIPLLLALTYNIYARQRKPARA